MPNYVMRLARIQVSKGSGFFKDRIRNSYLLVADPQRCFNNCLQYYLCTGTYIYTVPKVIEFPRYNMKCSGENVILGGIVHVVSGFPLQYISCYIAEILIAFLTGYSTVCPYKKPCLSTLRSIGFYYIIYISYYSVICRPSDHTVERSRSEI